MGKTLRKIHMDQEQDFEEFAKRHPDLVQKSRQEYLGVGAGWYNILDVLFGMLSYDVDRARRELNYAMENPTSKYIKPIIELEANLAKALEELPTIVQIKEKFGGLRFYTDGGTKIHQAYIDFAAGMAAQTCEVCGSPGSLRDSSWMKTLCDKHHKETEDERIKEYDTEDTLD
jgi:hypothetical protein